jgi:hypothetical protein
MRLREDDLCEPEGQVSAAQVRAGEGKGLMRSVAFNPENHTYEDGLPSVTQVLTEAGLLCTDFCTEEGRQRGSAVHTACHYYDEGDLDLESVDPSIQGYLEAYIKWRTDTGNRPDWIETPIRSQAYAGIPDRIMILRPRALWDLKSGPYQHWHRLQAAAYVNMLDDPWSYSRFGLYLRTDGTYSIKEFPKSEYARDLNTFLSCLNIYNWRKIYGC